MSARTTGRLQYQRIVDHAANHCTPVRVPLEGWLRTVRRALGLSGAQLAKKLGVSRARVAQAEAAELTGGITLKSMQAAAEAMGCRFVYAIVPSGRIEDIITAQARKKAIALVQTTSTHMALESQLLEPSQINEEIDRLTREIAAEMGPRFWDAT